MISRASGVNQIVPCLRVRAGIQILDAGARKRSVPANDGPEHNLRRKAPADDPRGVGRGGAFSWGDFPSPLSESKQNARPRGRTTRAALGSAGRASCGSGGNSASRVPRGYRGRRARMSAARRANTRRRCQRGCCRRGRLPGIQFRENCGSLQLHHSRLGRRRVGNVLIAHGRISHFAASPGRFSFAVSARYADYPNWAKPPSDLSRPSAGQPPSKLRRRAGLPSGQ